MKYLQLLLGVCLCLLPMEEQTMAAQNPHETVTVGVYQNNPKVFVNENGQPQGFWVDLVNEIGKQENLLISYVPCEWSDCLEGIRLGKLDLMPDVAYSQERDRIFDFNHEVVLASWSQVYARQGLKLETIIDLKGQKIGVLADSIQEEYIRDYLTSFAIKPKLSEFQSFNEIFVSLEKGEIDAGIINHLYSKFASSKFDVQKTNILLNPSRLHFIVPEGDPKSLLPRLDRTLEKLINNSNSIYYQAKKQWLEPPATLSWLSIKNDIINLSFYFPFFALFFLSIWSYSLKKEIHHRICLEKKLEESEQNYSSLAAAVPVGIFRTDKQYQCIYVNEYYTKLTGVSFEDAVAGKWIDSIHSDERESVWQLWLHCIQENQLFESEYRFVHPDGKVVWVYVQSLPEYNFQGEMKGYVGTLTDISDRKQAEIALAESRKHLGLVTKNMSDLVCLMNNQGQYLYVTPSCHSLLGYTPDELINHDPREFYHPDDDEYIRQHYSLNFNNTLPLTYRYRHKSGHYLWLETINKPIYNEKGELLYIQSTSRNVSERILVQNQLKHDALHDKLTGLPNRNLLIKRLDLALKRSKRDQKAQFAVLFFDLDNFKLVNDSLGHLSGDELLIQIANLLQNFIRETDIASRLGGDEFVILLEEIESLQEAVMVAQRIIEALRSPFEIEDKQLFTSTSIGIVTATDKHKTPEDVLRDADIAMYRAKQSGKGKYAIFV